MDSECYNSLMIEDKVRATLFSECRVQAGQSVVVGFSGGADSLCLLHLLAQLPIRVIAAYFDHGLRPESGREEDPCRELAGKLGVDFVSGQGDVKGYAAEQKLSIEEAARIKRYQFLFMTAENEHADAVAVAHQADDQVETFLMHLMRGAGSDGLSGMRFVSADPMGFSSIPLIRPLLGIWREEIQQFCRENHLTPIEDKTNQETTYFRNRIRLELVPELQSYNPQIKQHLWQTAAILSDEIDGLEITTRETLSTLVDRRGEHWMMMNRVTLLKQPVWLQRRLLRRALFELKSTLRDVDFGQVDRALRFIADPGYGNTCQLDADLEIFRAGDESVLLAQRQTLLVDLWPQVDFDQKFISEQEGAIDLPGGWQIRVKKQDLPIPTTLDEDPWKACLDADKLRGSLSVGKRRKGELFEPYGLGGKKTKVGDFFTNVHLPIRARDHWPLVRCSDEVVWIPGYRISERCKVTNGTKHLVQIVLRKK